jgi:hypothetical protein
MKLFALALLSLASLLGDNIIWSGDVNANGDSTPSIGLIIGKRYTIKADGTVNLGNWYQDKEKLLNDACFQFNVNVKPTAWPTLKNSNNIQICDGNFHEDHIYVSRPFIAAQSGIHFWIYDTNYEDNTGSLHVTISEVTDLAK